MKFLAVSWCMMIKIKRFSSLVCSHVMTSQRRHEVILFCCGSRNILFPQSAVSNICALGIFSNSSQRCSWSKVMSGETRDGLMSWELVRPMHCHLALWLLCWCEISSSYGRSRTPCCSAGILGYQIQLPARKWNTDKCAQLTLELSSLAWHWVIRESCSSARDTMIGRSTELLWNKLIMTRGHSNT